MSAAEPTHLARRIALEQLAIVALTIVVLFIQYAIWGPPFRSARSITLGTFTYVAPWAFAALEYLWFARFVAQRKPAPPTTLGQRTFWLGVASCAVLFTSFCLGWMTLLLAPAGLVTGTIVLVREFRAGTGHEFRNLVGIGCCVAAILFLAA